MLKLFVVLLIAGLFIVLPADARETDKTTVSCAQVNKGRTIPLSVRSTDAVGVFLVEIYINDTLYHSWVGNGFTGVYTVLWEVPRGNNRIYQMQFVAYDAAGNTRFAKKCMLATW